MLFIMIFIIHFYVIMYYELLISLLLSPLYDVDFFCGDVVTMVVVVVNEAANMLITVKQNIPLIIRLPILSAFDRLPFLFTRR